MQTVSNPSSEDSGIIQIAFAQMIIRFEKALSYVKNLWDGRGQGVWLAVFSSALEETEAQKC